MPKQDGCEHEFHISGYVGYGYVAVGQRNGILELKRYLSSLPTDRNGVGRLTVNVLAINKCFWPEERFTTGLQMESRVKIIIKFIVFPIKFGDRLLLRYASGRIPFRIRQSNIFQGKSGPSSLHRMVRGVSKKIESKAFNQMIASIRVQKTLEFVINEILRIYVTRSESMYVC